MTIYFTVVLMAVVAAAIVLLPLWQKRADLSLGLGQEDADESTGWVDQKNRIAAQLGELDIALAEGKIDAATYSAEKSRLALDGDRVLKALNGARVSHMDDAENHVARTYPAFGIACGVLFISATSGLSFFLGNQVLNRNVSPHADGSVALSQSKQTASAATRPSPERDKQAAAKRPPVFGADGQPDVGAMVARLEQRVAKPDAPVKDIMMLARSYRVLGREDEAIALYERAVTLAPNDAGVLMISGQMLSRSGDKAVQAKGDKIIDRILASRPDNPEALWLKSLGLIRRHKVVEATKLLRRLGPLVEGNPKAKKAVNDLLGQLAQAASTPAVVPQKQ